MEARDIIERVNRIDAVYVPHTAVERAILGIEECVARSRGAAEPRNCIITGLSGTGKTTSRKAVLSCCNPRGGATTACGSRTGSRGW